MNVLRRARALPTGPTARGRPIAPTRLEAHRPPTAPRLKAHRRPAPARPARPTPIASPATVLLPSAMVTGTLAWLARRRHQPHHPKPWLAISANYDPALIEPSPVGTAGTTDYAVYFKHLESTVSPWHDIPCCLEEGVYYFVNEIPLGTQAKMEVTTTSEHNPILQDTKNGELRYLTYDMGVGGIPFNYGMIPQTFEDPTTVSEDTGCVGDADPIDVVELSETPFGIGEIRKVKVLGVLAMIDEGETDWKLITIDVEHPRAASLNSIEDLCTCADLLMLERVREWFRMYKTADGKAENSFAFDGKFQGREYAIKVVEEVHGSYNQLLDGTLENTNGWWLP